MSGFGFPQNGHIIGRPTSRVDLSESGDKPGYKKESMIDVAKYKIKMTDEEWFKILQKLADKYPNADQI